MAWCVEHADAVSLLLIVFAALRILATLTVFSATADEPLHVTAGLQFVKEGKYAWQLENPPIPRVVFGWLISLGGAQFDPHREPIEMMRWLFYSSGHYKTALFLARAGNLVFFIGAAVATWWLARRFLGRSGGLLAALLFTTQPVLLGYAGIANLDTASVTGLAIALIAFWRWLEKPTQLRAFLTGLAYGFSIGLKLSDLLFTAAACVAIFLVQEKKPWLRAVTALPIVIAGTFLGLWATYGFAFGSMEEFGLMKPHLNESIVARWIEPLEATTPIPMPHFLVGLSGIAGIDKGGFYSYAFGLRTHDGWWWYFPAATIFKTALATLIFAGAAFWFARDRLLASCMAVIAGIFIVCAPSSLDIGIRYALPLYVPLTIAAAAAALAMLRSANRRARIAAIVLLSWQSIASLAVHPDYFPYFNELGGTNPGWAFVDSNLDWGQDMLRLREVLREKKIDKIGIVAAGLHDYPKLGFPPVHEFEPWNATQGWVAVSEHMYRMMEPDGGFWWLRHRPYRRIGQSIRLYYVP